MALQKCHECGKDVSDEAKSCPSCGAKVKKPLTLRGLALVAIVGMFVYSCTSNMQRDPAPAAEPVQASVEQVEEGLYRHVDGDKGKYYLLEKQVKDDGNVIATHKRQSPESLGFSKTEINCKTMQFRGLAYGEGALENMKPTKDRWADVVQGSSKADLVQYVCKK